jgi:Flp pilus assembly protein TadG
MGRRGLAAIEFALLAPALFILLVGTIDITRYVSAALTRIIHEGGGCGASP